MQLKHIAGHFVPQDCNLESRGCTACHVGRPAVLAAASSLSHSCQHGTLAHVTPAAVERAHRLLAYVDANASVLFAYSPVGKAAVAPATPAASSGFFSRLLSKATDSKPASQPGAGVCLTDLLHARALLASHWRVLFIQLSSAEPSRDAEEAAAFAASLQALHWVPCVSTSPQPWLPWPTAAVPASCASSTAPTPASATATALAPAAPSTLCPFAMPGSARPASDLWLCSASLRILDADVTSVPLKAFFQFDAPLPVPVVAHQLARLGEASVAVRDRAIVDGTSADDGADSSAAVFSHALGSSVPQVGVTPGGRIVRF